MRQKGEVWGIDGSNVIMSARLLWANSLWVNHDPDYIALIHSHTFTNNNESPMYDVTRVHIKMAKDDALVIAPDYLGFGESADEERSLEQVQSLVVGEVLKEIETACKLLNITPG